MDNFKRLTSEQIVDHMNVLQLAGLRNDHAASFLNFITDVAKTDNVPTVDVLYIFYKSLMNLGGQ